MTISTLLDVSNIALRQSSRSITVNNIAAFPISKSVLEPVRQINQTISYTLKYINQSLTDATSAVMIDVFPYNGDGAGSNITPRVPATNFSGTMSLLSYSGSNGETFTFTNASPTSVYEDPCHVSNIPLGITA